MQKTLKTTSPYVLDIPTIRYRKIVQSFKPKILFLLKSDSLLDGHKYHNMGQAAGLTEPLDKRIVKYLKKLIRNGCRNSKDLQSRAAEFVQDKIFFGEKHPDSLRRKFNPNRKKIKNLVTSVKIETRYSKIDQENVAKLKEDWKNGAISISHQSNTLFLNKVIQFACI